MSLPVQSIPFTGDGLIIGGRVLYYGCNIAETDGAVATVNVYDGTSTAGKLIDVYGFAALGTARGAPFHRGVLCEQGIYIDEATGAVSGVLYYMPSWILDAQAIVDSAGSQRYVSQYFTQPDLYRAFTEIED